MTRRWETSCTWQDDIPGSTSLPKTLQQRLWSRGPADNRNGECSVHTMMTTFVKKLNDIRLFADKRMRLINKGKLYNYHFVVPLNVIMRQSSLNDAISTISQVKKLTSHLGNFRHRTLIKNANSINNADKLSHMCCIEAGFFHILS